MCIKYSIIIPVYNEFYSVFPLYKAIINVMDESQKTYEIIFVNDGSDYNYGECANKMDRNIVRIIDLPRHYGQTAALERGFKEAKGEFIFSLDGDLQDNPKYMLSFISKINMGFDVVCGYRMKRKDDKIKIVSSKFGNFMQRVLLRTKIHDICCTYRLYKKECIDDLKLIRKGYHRYIPFLLIMKGYKITEIMIEQDRRQFGHSKYKSWKILAIMASLLLLISDILRRRV